jgi:dTDP-4-amino-4,6-dideoxygalactose transaminase
VIEDAAHALGAAYHGRRIGAISPATVFSLHAVKNVTTAEGGVLTTDDDGLADRVRVMGLHGMNKDAWQRFAPGGSWRYDIVCPGYKCNMTDIQAAMGLHQLAKAERFWTRRREIVGRYREGLGDIAELVLPDDYADGRHSWHLYPVRLRLERLAIGRDRFIELLKAAGISANVHYLPVHLFTYYRETFGFKPGDFPVAERLSAAEVTLPLYTRLTDDDVDDVIAAVRSIVSGNRR